jgi:hypothetical protein
MPMFLAPLVAEAGQSRFVRRTFILFETVPGSQIAIGFRPGAVTLSDPY